MIASFARDRRTERSHFDTRMRTRSLCSLVVIENHPVAGARRSHSFENGGGIIVQPQYTLLELSHAEALGEVFSYLNRLNPELRKGLFGGRHFRLHWIRVVGHNADLAQVVNLEQRSQSPE